MFIKKIFACHLLHILYKKWLFEVILHVEEQTFFILLKVHDIMYSNFVIHINCFYL